MEKILRKRSNNLILCTFCLAIVFIFINVFAQASTTSLSISFRDTSVGNGKVQYSLDDGAHWIDIEQNTNLNNLNVMGDNLRLKIVPRENYSIDWAGIEVNGVNVRDNEAITDAFQSGDGYSVPANVLAASIENVEFGVGDAPIHELNATSQITVSISGSELEYNQPWTNDASDFVFGINNGDMKRLSKEEVNYETENNEIVGLTTKQAFEYQYDYNNEETVRFTIRTQWNDLYTSLKINNVEYNTPKTQNALLNAYQEGAISFEIVVPKEDTYNIVIEGRKQHENEIIMGNFGWTYDSNSNEYSDDDKIPHGNLEFVEAKYNNVTYTTVNDVNAVGGVFKWKEANKDNDPFGEATFPPGTELTVRLIPDSGYQLIALTLNGNPFEVGEEVGVYTFTIGGGNWHLGANFAEIGNEVDAKADRVDNGSVSNVSFNYGTAKLEVDNVASMSPAREEKFVEAANEYVIDNYLEISLFNTIYKGGEKDANNKYLSWDTEVNNLQNNATIELVLNGDIDGNDVAIIHEKHLDNNQVEYEVINAQYDSKTNKVTFETNSFSTYAIAVKSDSEEHHGDSTDDTPYTISSGDNSISFNEEAGHTYHFEMIDYLSFTKEEVMMGADITSEQYDQIFDGVKRQAEAKGVFVSFFNIRVYENVEPDPNDPDDNGQRDIHEGLFTVKIKMTEELRKYTSFKMYYVDENFNLSEEAINFEVSEDGNYLVGTLKHLSPYVLVGNEENSATPDTINPKTSDNIMTYVVMFIVSAILLFSTIITIRRKRFD